MECQSVNARNILDVVRESGDTNLGQTLLRLARLAEANHRFQSVANLASREHDDARLSFHASDLTGRIDASDTCEEQIHDCKDAAALPHAARRSSSVCTEVNR